MEFSFDRSKDSHLRKPENNSVPPQRPNLAQTAQAHAAPQPGPDLNSQDPSTIANERLRKAIERNRAKQAAMQSHRPASAPPVQPATNFTQAQAEEYHQQNSLFGSQAEPAPPPRQEMRQEARQEVRQELRPEEVIVEPSEREIPQREAPQAEPTREMPRARERLSSRLNMANRQAAKEAMQEPAPVNERVKEGAMISRRSVAKPEDTEFVPIKRAPKKVATHISYTTNSTRKKSKSVDPKYITWLVKGSWIFCGIMVLRLIFANGGVTDFYSQKSTLNERATELTEIKQENMQLVREIERMKSDTGFQKKLVRDNLGFIASDEFLVLFPKEK